MRDLVAGDSPCSVELPSFSGSSHGRCFYELKKVHPVWEQLGHQLRTCIWWIHFPIESGLIRAGINLNRNARCCEEDSNGLPTWKLMRESFELDSPHQGG